MTKKKLPFQFGVALGTLMTTGFTCIEAQALVPETNFFRSATPNSEFVTQSRNVDELLRQASNLLEVSKYQEALVIFEQVVKVKPDSFNAWYLRGYALNKLGRHQEAVSSCDQSLKIKPNYVLALREKGIAFNKLQRYEAAVTVFEQALKIDSQDHQCWSQRGLALSRLNRYEEAIVSLERAQKIEPDDAETAEYLRVIQGVVAVKGEVRTSEARLEKTQVELRQLDEKKQVATREITAMQSQMCTFREKLSEMEVGIRQLMGAQQTSGVVQSCPIK